MRRIAYIATVAALALVLAACGDTDAETTTTEALATTAAPTTEAPPTTAAPTTTVAAFEAPEGALVSVPVDAAPELDGEVDALWADAPQIDFTVSGGANTGEHDVTVKSVYSGDMVYFLVNYTDPTLSLQRSPWVLQEDGSWAKLLNPDDGTKHGANNTYYEDKMAIIWNINSNPTAGFEQQGCFVLCHAGENSDTKAFGNKYTPNEGEIVDMWHWKSVRTWPVGQIDDQYTDSGRWAEDRENAGRHGDPKDGGGYVNNQTEDKSGPAFMQPDGGAKDGIGAILASEAVAIDASLFQPGDMVPGIVTEPFTGDRADILAEAKYADGAWTVELSRKLVTGSQYDVQFDDMAAKYFFGLAVFDNAQVMHSWEQAPSTLVFQP